MCLSILGDPRSIERKATLGFSLRQNDASFRNLSKRLSALSLVVVLLMTEDRSDLKEYVMHIVKKPRIGITLGDAAGIGPELVAKLLSDPATLDRARVILIGDDRQWNAGISLAKASPPKPRKIVSAEQIATVSDDFLLLDFPTLDPSIIQFGKVDAQAGKAVLDTLLFAVRVASEDWLDGYLFAPLNKEAMHKAGSPYASELELFKDSLCCNKALEEINILDESWTMRVTSHVAIKDVAGMITTDKVLMAIRFLDESMRGYGIINPRLAVSALNPHGGEHGLFGDEEAKVIEPAIRKAKEEAILAEGPYPADTIFIRLRDRKFDAVISMYHDQCQIATKLMGFHRGVTYHAGFKIPITTPAHGTAFDIAGKGTANVGATRHAFDIVCKIAANNT